MKVNFVQIIRLLRPDHWIKNVGLLFPAFFGQKIGIYEQWSHLGLGFVCFSCMASAIYTFNDLKDVHQDQLHPIKKLRPIA